VRESDKLTAVLAQPLKDPFWDRHKRELWRETGSEAIAEDLLQKVKIKLLKWSAGGRSAEHLGGLIAITRKRVLIDWQRRRIPERHVIVEREDDRSQRDEAAPNADAESRIWDKQVRAVFDELPLTDRQRAILESMQEPVRTVADRLGMSVSAVTTARNKLKAKLRKNEKLRELLLELIGRAA